MEAILKSLAGWAFSLVRDYSLCFVLVRLWAWSAVEALHLPPVGMVHVLAALLGHSLLTTDVRKMWADAGKEEWTHGLGYTALSMGVTWFSFGIVWLVRWWLAP